MKKKIVSLAVIGLAFLQLGTSQPVSAESLDSIRNQQEQTKQELQSLQVEVSTVIEEVSTLNETLNILNQNITEKEAEIAETLIDVAEQEKIVEARLEQASERLQSLQVNEVSQNFVLTILGSESLSDLFNRALVIMRLTDAGNQQIELAEIEAQTLIDLKEKLVVSRQELKAQQEEAVVQKEALDDKVAILQTLIQENQSELSSLVQREAEEVARIEEARRVAREAAERAAAERKAEEAAQQAAAEKAAKQASVAQAEKAASEQEASTSSSKASAAVTQTASKPAAQPAAPKKAETKPAPKAESKPAAKTESKPAQTSGKTLNVQATGYSTKQPGLSTHTFMGIDLRVNSRVIAVDPSVIPLGSMVEVEGMGVYIAGDTGGAIKGNIIDIHFNTVAEALQWGRRNVTVRILNK